MENTERPPATGSLSQGDHDALIELKTSFKGFLDQYKIDMRELKDGVKVRVDEHDIRLKKIESDLLTIGGVTDAWRRFIAVERWVEEFDLKWKTIIGAAVTIGSVVTFTLGLIGKLTGVLK